MSCVQFSKAVQLSLLALLWKWNLRSLQIVKSQQKHAWFVGFFTVLKVRWEKNRVIKSTLLNFIFYKVYLKIEDFVVKLFFYTAGLILGNVYSLTSEQIVLLSAFQKKFANFASFFSKKIQSYNYVSLVIKA